ELLHGPSSFFPLILVPPLRSTFFLLSSPCGIPSGPWRLVCYEPEASATGVSLRSLTLPARHVVVHPGPRRYNQRLICRVFRRDNRPPASPTFRETRRVRR